LRKKDWEKQWEEWKKPELIKNNKNLRSTQYKPFIESYVKFQYLTQNNNISQIT